MTLRVVRAIGSGRCHVGDVDDADLLAALDGPWDVVHAVDVEMARRMGPAPWWWADLNLNKETA